MKNDLSIAIQNDNGFISCTNYILALYYEILHNVINTAPILTALDAKMIAQGLLTEEVHVINQIFECLKFYEY